MLPVDDEIIMQSVDDNEIIMPSVDDNEIMLPIDDNDISMLQLMMRLCSVGDVYEIIMLPVDDEIMLC